MKEFKIGTLVAMMLSAGALQAQDGPLRGTVNVDGKYLPDVIRQDRVNILPRLYSFQMESMSLDYDKTGVTTQFEPTFSSLPVTGWQTDRTIRDYRGYLDLNLGSWLNSSVSAGVRPLNDENNRLAVWLQHNSTSLYAPKLTHATEKIKQQRYDETVGVNYNHLFNESGRLSFALDYHLRYFNYYGFTAPTAQAEGLKELSSVPTQTVNDVTGRIGWSSLKNKDLTYDVSLGARYYGFRRLYLYNVKNPADPESLKGQKETHLDLSGKITYSFDDASSLGAKVTGDMLFYDTPEWTHGYIDSYGQLEVTPYYRFNQGNLDINIGANLDFTFNAGPIDYRYQTFHISPDVCLDYRAGIAGLFLHLKGGTYLNTLASQSESDYYCIPAILRTNPSYSPIDGVAGINFGPMAGMTAGLAFAYKSINNVPLNGLYTLYLNNNIIRDDASGRNMYLLYPDGINVRGWSVRANIGFEISRKMQLAIDGSYQPQNGTNGYWNGIDRPRWILNAQCTFSPVDPLHITLQYSYRGVRNVYAHYTRPSAVGSDIITGGAEYEGYHGIRLPDITDLALKASYNINSNFSVTVQAENLLNRKIQLLPDVVSQGINVMGGVQLTF